MYDVGEFLKNKRLEKNLTTKEMADKLSVDEEVVKSYELDKNWGYNDSILLHVAKILDIQKEDDVLGKYITEEWLKYKSFLRGKIYEDNMHIDCSLVYELEEDDIDISDMNIYLRPIPREGLFGVMSPVVNIKSNEVYNKCERNMCIDSEYFSKAWFEIVALVKDENYNSSHIVIGHLTGYLINSDALSDDLNYNNGNSSIFAFDEASQMLSNLWCDFAHGNLKPLTTNEYDLFYGNMYFLNNISIDKKYTSKQLYKSVLKLIPYMFEYQFKTDISHIVFSKGVTELDDMYFDTKADTQTGLSEIEEDKCLKEMGFKKIESLANYSYQIVECNNSYYDLRWKTEW